MAKKKDIDPASLTMEEKLKTLYQLQQLLSQIDDIRTLRGELPLEVEDLENEIEGLHTRMENLTADASELHDRVNEFKTQLDKATSALTTYEEQINNVRNSREYEMLSKEIEYQKLQIELFNKRSKDAQETEAVKRDIIRQTQESIDQRTIDLDAKKNELDTIIDETRAEEEKLTERAKGLEQRIEERLRNAFHRIRSNTRNGLGIVYVNRDACGGCFAKIPPQRQLEVRQRRKLIVCEYCGRILIDPELAGVETTSGAPQGTQAPKRRRTATRAKAKPADTAASKDTTQDTNAAKDE